MKIKVLLALVFIFPSLTAYAADDDRRDGNWWREQQQLIKLGYMIGFLDGEHLGNKFSYWKFMNDPDGQSCLTKVVNWPQTIMKSFYRR